MAAQQTKIQIYFDFFFINRKINFARSAHSNTHTHTRIPINAYRSRQQNRSSSSGKESGGVAGACSHHLFALSCARSLSDCSTVWRLAACPIRLPVCQCVRMSGHASVRGVRVCECVCVSIISKEADALRSAFGQRLRCHCCCCCGYCENN